MPGNTENRNGRKWKIKNVFKNLDNYGKEVPTFNLGGETRVSTVCGGIISVLVMILTLTYSIVKLTQLINKDNPNINQVAVPDYYAPTYRQNLNDINFQMAFTVEDSHGNSHGKI